MRAWEQAAIDRGLDVATLMGRAGAGIAQAIGSDPRCPDPILILAGPGNNGGDAIIAAQHLADRGRQVRCFLWRRSTNAAPPPPPDAEVTSVEGVGIAGLQAWLGDAGTIVDGLLGTGRSRPAEGALQGILAALTARLQQSPRPRVVAVDVPSGTDADTGSAEEQAVRADVTVALGSAKAGTLVFPAAEHAGAVNVIDIGLPTAAEPVSGETIGIDLVASLLPSRRPDSNKGSFGKVLVIGGSERYVGAPCLAAHAAGRVGAGLVTLATPRCIHPIVAAKLNEVIFAPQDDRDGALAPASVAALAELSQKSDAVAFGPGLSQAGAAPDVVRGLLAALRDQPGSSSLVIDADALNALAATPRWWRAIPEGCVLTPHPGEMGRLLQMDARSVQADRVGLVRRAAQQWRQHVVLKGAHTLVARPDGRWWLMPSANPALATAGTGDVLCGSIGGLLAQGLAPWAAAVCGVWLHAQAGDAAARTLGTAGVLAGDLLAELPRAMQRARR